MLNITKYILSALFIMPLCSSCNVKEEPESKNSAGNKEANKEIVFSAVLPDAGAGFKTSWSEGDEILVYSIKGNFTAKELIKASAVTDGGKKATFKSSGKLLSDAGKFYAFVKGSGVKNFKLKKYWSPSNMDRCSDASPTVTVATCTGEDLNFKFVNVYALLEFDIENPAVKYVRFSGNNGETINKSMFVSFDEFKILENNSPDFSSTTYIRKYVSGAGKYYIGLDPTIVLKTGYTLTAFDENNSVLEKVSNFEELAVESGKTYVAEKMKEPRVPSPVFDEENIVRSFGVISDVHIETEGDDYAKKFKSALSQLKTKAAQKDPNGLDAVLVVGDLINNKRSSQISAYKNLYESELKPSEVPMIYTIGNHDMNENYRWTSTTVADNSAFASILGEDYFKTDIDNNMRRNYEARHCVVGGYHILAVTPNSDEPINYAPAVLDWLDKQLKELTEQNPEQYVLVLTHPMIQNTVYGSLLGTGVGGIWASDLKDFWATNALTHILKKYPQALVFGGHLHFPLNDPRTIWQGDFTVLGTASVRYMAIEPASYEDMKSATVMNDANDFSQGYLAQIDINGNVRFHRMDFYNKAEIGESWTIKFPAKDASHLASYNHTSLSVKNQKPLLGTANVTSPEAAASSVSFSAGTDDEFVHDYLLTLKKDASTVMTKKILADFYKHAKPGDMKKEWNVELGTLEKGEYELTIVANDSWGAQSDPLVKNFTVGKTVETKTVDEWKNDEAGSADFDENGTPAGGDGWLSYAGGKVSWTANTTGAPRQATLTFASGSKFTLTQLAPDDFKGNYSITAKFFSKCDWIKSTDNNKPGELKNIVFGDPLRGEKLKDVDGMEYTNMIGIKGLYYEAVCDATVVIDYENKIVKLGVFLDARNNAQKVNNKVTGYNYACFLPGMGTGTGTTWAAPWNFVQPDLSSKEETDYTWLWFNCSEDLQSFNFNPSKAGQTLNTDLAGSAKQICAITVAVSKSAKVKGSDVNPNWNAVYQGNTFKVDTRHGVTFWRE